MSGPNPALPLPPALILAGPTGAGKTELAVQLALAVGGELVSADSMQVYRGMAVGTAQPSAAELRGVRIHACGVLEPEERFNAQRFLDLGEAAHREIAARGAFPIYVGGTGLYLRALRWGLLEEPEGTEGLRAELERELEALGPAALRERLAALDPAAAAKIAPTDRVRVVRALELALAAGRPLGELRTQWPRPQARFPHELAILNPPRAELMERIDRRADAMLAAGWIEEVRALVARGIGERAHCMKALGYRQILEFLAGRISEEDMRSQIKAKTRQFAKRQMTWFRREIGAHWIESGAEAAGQPLVATKKLVDRLRGAP